MKAFSLLRAGMYLAVFVWHLPVFSQCAAPEVIRGADKYNLLLCSGVAAQKHGDYRSALRDLLEAARLPTLEFPNNLLFGRIAETYARLGQFEDADLYMRYDNLSLLWMIGVVRCQAQADSNDEVLMQDGKLLESMEAKHMVNVLCGAVFDSNYDFTDRNADSFAGEARAILRHEAIRKEIERLRKAAPK